MKESNIIYEAGRAWVGKQKHGYIVYVKNTMHSVSDSTYLLTADGLGLAICRADWFNRVPGLAHLPVHLTLNLARRLHK